MIRKITTLFLCLFSLISASAASAVDPILTTYKDGEFKTVYETRIKTSNKIASDVADYLVSDFHNSPGHLFQWAFKDLGLQNKNNEIIIIDKSANTDPKTGITHGVFDVVVPHFKTFRNVKVDAIVSKTQYSNGEIKVSANIIYSSLLLKSAVGIVTFLPQRNNEMLLVTNAGIRFGWFFNIFITKGRYKSIVEWRIKKFAENLKAECEKRAEK